MHTTTHLTAALDNPFLLMMEPKTVLRTMHKSPALRGLHQQIRDHAQQRSAGRPERANDVKLSRGGIREIEFIVQLLHIFIAVSFCKYACRSNRCINGISFNNTFMRYFFVRRKSVSVY